MRITPFEQRKIREISEDVFGDGVIVRLFGSRVDDSKKGGDIDIYIDPQKKCPQKSYLKAKLWARLQLELGEQKIDIVVANKEKLDIDREAMLKGVVLHG